jgi:hypothetical protein
MGEGVGPWSRLIEDHWRNAQRLEAEGAPPPSWWGLPLGVLVPWLPFGVALAWSDPSVVVSSVVCLGLLVPVGLVFLFVERLQHVAVGLVLGMLGVLFVAQAVLR